MADKSAFLARALILLERLVAFPTVPDASNLDLIDFCGDYLTAYGVESHRVPSPDGRHAALYATIGPRCPGGVVLSGHVDVVPVEGQVWTSDPWRLTERDGRLYGRGSCDMKGFIALMLAAVPELRAAPLARPVHLALSYDEEVGFAGAHRLVPVLKQSLPMPQAVIVGEPTRHQLVNGHKAYAELETRLRGHAIHSGRADLGVSAVTMAARLIGRIDEMDRENAARAAARPPLFQPNYTTLHCGRMEGGVAASTVAAHAWFSTDIRAVPWEKADDYIERLRRIAADIEAEMQEKNSDCGIDMRVIVNVPGLSPEGDRSATALVQKLLPQAALTTVAYGTEAGMFQQAGWSSVVCGPGDILQAHRPDEYIERTELVAGVDALTRLTQALC